MTGKTITAVATPMGESAVGVLRLSGEKTFSILSKIFRSRKNISREKREIYIGRMIRPEDQTVLDEIVLLVYPGPHSYTGEDLAEISCHGNPFLIKEVLDLILSQGAVMAEPGEFTQRAYLNGRMDLSRAEAVNDLIRAHTPLSRQAALNRLEGRFSGRIQPIQEKILDILALVEAAIDHSDMEEEFISKVRLEKDISEIISLIQKLLSTAPAGKMISSGMQVVIAGAPNTGKSSLMNKLLQEDRVIVSDIPGTTRDTVEDELSIRGIPVRLLDTAGLRNSNDKLENAGMERTKKAVEAADLRIVLFDASRNLDEADVSVLSTVKDLKNLYFLNKTDLKEFTTQEQLKRRFGIQVEKISISADHNVEAVESAVEQFYYSFGCDPRTDVLVSNSRQEALLKKSAEFLEKALKSAGNHISEELIAADIRYARNSIEEITGKTTDDAVLDRIFSQFCIGK